MLPRSWNGQFVLLLVLLFSQFFFFLYVILLPSPVFDSPLPERFSLQNDPALHPAYVQPTNSGGDAILADQPSASLTWLERIRWRIDSWRSRAIIQAPQEDRLHVKQTADSTLPASSPSSPPSSSSLPLPALPLSRQSRFHLHSRFAYPLRWLDHVGRRSASRSEIQAHMREDTLYEKLDALSDSSDNRKGERGAGAAEEGGGGDQGNTEVAAPASPSSAAANGKKTPKEKTAAAAAAAAAAVAVAEAEKKGGKREGTSESKKEASTPSSSSSPPSSSSSSPFSSYVRSWSSRALSPACNSVLGSSLLLRWDSSKSVFCEEESNPPLSVTSEVDDKAIRTAIERVLRGEQVSHLLPAGRLVCRSATLDHMPPPTAPHSFCSASNVFIDFSTFESGADAPKFRAGYVMGKGNHYHFKEKRSFSANCELTQQRRLGDISADHQRDIVDAFGAVNQLGGGRKGGEGSKQQEKWKQFLEKLALQRVAISLREDLRSQILAPSAPFPPPPSSSSSPVPLLVLPYTLIVVTRENGEHCNFYHTMTDLFNAFLMFRHFGLRRESTRLLLLDNHGPSPFDEAWQKVFSGAGKIIRANEIIPKEARGGGEEQAMLLASSLILSPPGYSSPLYRFLYEDDSECRSKVDLFPEFAQFFLEGFGVQFQRWSREATLRSLAGIEQEEEKKAVRQTFLAPGPPSASSSSSSSSAETAPSTSPPSSPFLHLVVVSRKPYDLFVSHHKISRQIFNEGTFLDFLTQASRADYGTGGRYENVRIDVIDLARITFEQQLKLIASADLLVGMHGAALSHAMFLPPWGALVELHPATQRWQCFKHQAEWSGHGYFAWRNPFPDREREDHTGSGLDVDTASFQQVIDKAIEYTRNKRKEIEKEIRGGTAL